MSFILLTSSRCGLRTNASFRPYRIKLEKFSLLLTCAGAQRYQFKHSCGVPYVCSLATTEQTVAKPSVPRYVTIQS